MPDVLDASPYDALLLLSFGGPEGPDDVVPFLENVTRGRGIPKERLKEVGQHYFLFGGVSPINDQNRALLDALRKDFAEHGLDLPVYWGNRNWAPYLTDTLREMAGDGRRRVLVLATSAYASYSGCRQYRENLADALAALESEGLEPPQVDKLRHYFNHPGFVEPMVDGVVRSLAELPEEVRDGAHIAFCTHSIPVSAADTSGPAEEHGDGGAYVRQHLDVAQLIADAGVKPSSPSSPPRKPQPRQKISHSRFRDLSSAFPRPSPSPAPHPAYSRLMAEKGRMEATHPPAPCPRASEKRYAGGHRKDSDVRVLVVEDEQLLADAVATGLRREAMAVDVVYDGAAALERIGVNDYDVVVLDRDLPLVHGDDVCRKIVELGMPTRVLMLTASGDVSDRVEGLEIGADDYLPKPFAFSELIARVRALGRRTSVPLPPVLERAGIKLDPNRREVFRDGKEVQLAPKEFAVLEVLMRSEGAVVSAEQLLEKAWDENTDPFTNVVRVTVMTLRRKLGEPPVIVTVPGSGYRI
ncbi:Ferrochelatase [Streptomyces tendae]